MPAVRFTVVLAVAALASPVVAAPRMPEGLPRYDLEVDLDVAGAEARVSQRVTWTNTHDRPATELVFNVHSHYAPPKGSMDYLFLAKMLEIMRVPASQGIYQGSACEIRKVWLIWSEGNTVTRRELSFAYREKQETALAVPLPGPVARGQSVTVELEFVFHLPQRQGRWGQWKGVTFLTNWLPVLAYYDEGGWDPVPFVAWHQPWFNEAGVYTARVALPPGEKVACTGPVEELPDSGQGRRVAIGPVVARDFALLTSKRYEVFAKDFGGVTVRCVAFPEHEHYARRVVDVAGRAIETYSKWFGPFPYKQMTYAESYFGWNGNECSDLVMIDERVFGMPHLMDGYLEYLVSHETCHQWFYNAIGTDGYRETWMDEAFANYFAHRLLDQVNGRNNPFLNLPDGLKWLPNINREDYRFSSFFTTLRRGELMPPNQEMAKYDHVGNLFAAAYDRGGKIVGMIEERLGPAAFLDFMRRVYSRYYFRVIKVKDFQRELEEYTGRSWEEFFQQWLWGAGMSDWSVESVTLAPAGRPAPGGATAFLESVQGSARGGPHRVVVVLHQKAELDEQTYLGFSFDGETFPLRVPVVPRAGPVTVDDPPCRVEPLPDHRVRVEIVLPGKPSQVAVDPDQVLPDSNPTNNYWRPRLKTRVTPFYTFIDEANLALAYDRWNLITGPWFYGPAYSDPWFTRADVFGYRVGVYRTDYFAGGVYTGYRADFRDVAAGVDATWFNVLPKVDVGLNAEKSLFQVASGGTDIDRAVVYARYIFQETPSLYTAPMHHVELFGSWQRNFLPIPRHPIPGKRFDTLSEVGVHYHADFLTPYWDPEIGFKFDATYASGFPALGQSEQTHRLSSQLSWVVSPPTDLGWLSSTRLALRAYGAYASPNDGQLFSLGGNLLFRGFDLQQRQGSRVWIGSAELRLPVVRESQKDALDHVIGLRNLYVVPFYDVGEAYINGQSEGGVAHALGVGLRCDVAWFSFIERTSLRLDFAKTLNAPTPLQIWVGIMHPF